MKTRNPGAGAGTRRQPDAGRRLAGPVNVNTRGRRDARQGTRWHRPGEGAGHRRVPAEERSVQEPGRPAQGRRHRRARARAEPRQHPPGQAAAAPSQPARSRAKAERQALRTPALTLAARRAGGRSPSRSAWRAGRAIQYDSRGPTRAAGIASWQDQDGSLSGGRARHALPAGHQGQPEGNAADRRQAADPVRGRGGAGGRRREAGVHHRLRQARDRGPLRHGPRARAGTRGARASRTCSMPCAASCRRTRAASTSASPRRSGSATRCCARARPSATSRSSCTWPTTSSTPRCRASSRWRECSSERQAACSACRPCGPTRPTSTASSPSSRSTERLSQRAAHRREAEAGGRAVEPRRRRPLHAHARDLRQARDDRARRGRRDPADRRHRRAAGGRSRSTPMPSRASATTAARSSATSRRPSSSRSKHANLGDQFAALPGAAGGRAAAPLKRASRTEIDMSREPGPAGASRRGVRARTRQPAAGLRRAGAQRRDVGRRGPALHRLRQRHRRAQHRAPASEGAGRGGEAARRVQPHLPDGHAVRVGGRTGREAQPACAGPDAEEGDLRHDRRRGGREHASRSRAPTPDAPASSRSAAASTAARSWPWRSPARWRRTRRASGRSRPRSTTRRSRSRITASACRTASTRSSTSSSTTSSRRASPRSSSSP